MTYDPNAWVDYGAPCIEATTLNNMEDGIDRAQGDVMQLWGLTAARPASDPLLIGRIYRATDTPHEISRDNGAGWDVVGYTSGIGDVILRNRYLSSVVVGAWGGHTGFVTAGRVHLSPVDVPWPVIVDRIIWLVGNNATGNVRLGIYEEGGAADSPTGADLVVESASIAIPGTQRYHLATIADTTLEPGQYFLGLQASSTLARYYHAWDTGNSIGFYYNRGGGYGAFTDPCPALIAYARIPLMYLRVKENLPLDYFL